MTPAKIGNPIVRMLVANTWLSFVRDGRDGRKFENAETVDIDMKIGVNAGREFVDTGRLQNDHKKVKLSLSWPR